MQWKRNVTADARCSRSVCYVFMFICHHLTSLGNSRSIGSHRRRHAVAHNNFSADSRYYELRFEICSAIFEVADVRSFVCFAFAVLFNNQHTVPCFNNMCLVPPIFLCISFYFLYLYFSFIFSRIRKARCCFYCELQFACSPSGSNFMANKFLFHLSLSPNFFFCSAMARRVVVWLSPFVFLICIIHFICTGEMKKQLFCHCFAFPYSFSLKFVEWFAVMKPTPSSKIISIVWPFGCTEIGKVYER